MNLVTDLQLGVYKKIKDEICNSVNYNIAGKNAIEVVTPFLDWKGVQVSFYITEDGKITDGGRILSQLKSLRAIEDFNNWPFRSGFFKQSCIEQERGRLVPINDDPKNVLSYVQGITRLPNYFEPKPIYSTMDRYPDRVRAMTIDALRPFAPSGYPEDERLKWATMFTKERTIKLNGIEVRSDMSPKRYFRMIQIFSHATSGSTDKRQHVEAKILHPVLWKREVPEVEMYAIVETLDAYASESRALLRQESDGNIIETCETGAEKEIARLLMEEPIAVSSD
jgi:hypothetical protein